VQLFCPSSGALDCVLQLVVYCTHDVAGHRPVTLCVHYTTSCNTQSSAREDGKNNYPKHVELTGIINKPLLLHLVGCLYYLYQWCTVKQTSDNERYLLIKYIKSVLWRVAKRLSYIEDARYLKVKWLPRVRCNKAARICCDILVASTVGVNRERGYTFAQPHDFMDWKLNERQI
jgi:hypothetical protein